MCASSPAPAMPRSIGRLAAGACTIREQPEQENFGRTYRMTLNCSGTRSRISLTSSPRYRSLPPTWAGTLGRHRGMWHRLARETCWQGLADRLALQRLGRLYRRQLLYPRGFELLDRELELVDAFIELFGGAPITGPLELREEELEVLDVKIAVGQRLAHRHDELL